MRSDGRIYNMSDSSSQLLIISAKRNMQLALIIGTIDKRLARKLFRLPVDYRTYAYVVQIKSWMLTLYKHAQRFRNRLATQYP